MDQIYFLLVEDDKEITTTEKEGKRKRFITSSSVSRTSPKQMVHLNVVFFPLVSSFCPFPFFFFLTSLIIPQGVSWLQRGKNKFNSLLKNACVKAVNVINTSSSFLEQNKTKQSPKRKLSELHNALCQIFPFCNLFRKHCREESKNYK